MLLARDERAFIRLVRGSTMVQQRFRGISAGDLGGGLLTGSYQVADITIRTQVRLVDQPFGAKLHT